MCGILRDAGSTARGCLQDENVSRFHQPRRLRPGCSETQASRKKSLDYGTADEYDKYNILTNYDIEMNDGNPGYYGDSGEWISYSASAPDGMLYGAEDPSTYEENQKNALPSNSYPSGHSSGMWSAALGLMEMIPDKAALIMKEANEFAVNRTIARYHWNSDTIQGRVLGTTLFAVAHATKGFDTDLLKCIKEAQGSGPEPTDPVSLDLFLENYNNKFFNNSTMTYAINEPITSESAVYPFLSDATDYFNQQYEIINAMNIMADDITVSSEYEISSVDKEACFGWFLAYLFTALYPFTAVGSDKTRNGRLFEIAFQDYSAVYKNCSYANIDGTQYLPKYAGAVLASVIFARMISDRVYRKEFKDLKETTYTQKCLQDYYFNDGVKFLYEDMYAPKGEDFFPLPPGTGNWIYNRDIESHDEAGKLRATTNPGLVALDDRESTLSYYLDKYRNVGYSNASLQKAVNTPSSVNKN